MNFVSAIIKEDEKSIKELPNLPLQHKIQVRSSTLDENIIGEPKSQNNRGYWR